jgi:NitT/TauT family transport system substrate-binding protein
LKRVVGAILFGAVIAAAAGAATAQTTIRVGWCARTITAAAAPYAIATKLGWFAQGGIRVELVPLPGGADCLKSLATGQIDYALASVEPLAAIRLQGARMKIFYTAFQGNIYGIAVPLDSPVRKISELRGKRIGVISMGSAGVMVCRGLVAMNGMDPDRDVSIVVAGEAAQTAALLRSKQVDALSQFDTQYALVENAGVKLRLLDTSEIERFPSNGFIASEETLLKRRTQAVALGQGYAKGTVFAMTHPEAAIRITWEMFPTTRPIGKDEATALHDDVRTLQARIAHWRLEAGGAARWGESVEANYGAYIEFLVRNGVLKAKVPIGDLVTNDLIGDINRFDPLDIQRLAKDYKER